MNRFVLAACFAVALTAVGYLSGGPTEASHVETLDKEPFDALSRGLVGNIGSPCAGFTSGNRVRAIQSLFYGDGELPFSGIDGLWGPNTENATKDWQLRHNLQVDGCFGRHSANHAQGNADGHGNHMNRTVPPDSGLGTYIYFGSSFQRTYKTISSGATAFTERVRVGSTDFTFVSCTNTYSSCTSG